MSDHCEWTMEDDDSDLWLTDCGEMFLFNSGGPDENKMLFCCYCGKPVHEDPGIDQWEEPK